MVFPVLLEQPFKAQEWHCAALAQGRCQLAAWADTLQLCPAKRMELEMRVSLGRKGEERPRRIFSSFDILLFASGEKNINESPFAVLVQVGLRHSVHEGEADNSQPVCCCCGHGLYLLHFCLSHCFTVHLTELFIQNNVLDCAGNGWALALCREARSV